MTMPAYAAAAMADALTTAPAGAADYDALLSELLGPAAPADPAVPAATLPELARAAGFPDPDDPAVVALALVLEHLVAADSGLLGRRLDDDEVGRIADLCEIDGDPIERRGLIEAALGRLADPAQKARTKKDKLAKAAKKAKAPETVEPEPAVADRPGVGDPVPEPPAEPKPPKEKKAKAAKAPREPKPAPAAEWRPLVGSEVALAGVPLQDRTKVIGLPATLRWEGVGGRAERDRHQIDHSRPEPYTPTMPCLRRLAETGNPYPSDPNDPVVRPHGEQYRPFVRISHEIWTQLSLGITRVELPDDAWAKGVCDKAGVPWTKDARACVTDTLRDLWTVGLLEQEVAGGRKRRFRKP